MVVESSDDEFVSFKVPHPHPPEENFYDLPAYPDTTFKTEAEMMEAGWSSFSKSAQE
ncbi:hypothetical protein PCANC_25847 [Puccinia coronata f. sp. avenae]|uniref:Uncharacterized protein n=1 Tax=Puccinia coronata f. sp. avenae TaxID=200324 RepID=A0A2N5TPJ1_9BASI|nr:hypothetical protein PCANC_25847 [Puccinia coronata f. sp. avenae]